MNFIIVSFPVGRRRRYPSDVLGSFLFHVLVNPFSVCRHSGLEASGSAICQKR